MNPTSRVNPTTSRSPRPNFPNEIAPPLVVTCGGEARLVEVPELDEPTAVETADVGPEVAEVLLCAVDVA